MPGVVQARTQEVVHRRIDDHEAPRGALFDVEHPGDQHAGVADQEAARLEHELGVQALGERAHHLGVGVQIGRRLVAVADAQPAAEIEPPEGHAGAHELAVEPDHALEGRAVGREVGHLRPDVDRQPLEREARQLDGAFDRRARVSQVDAELVLRLAGRNAVVGARVHVRVEPQRHRRAQPLVARDPGQRLHLGQRLDVELKDAGLEPERHLGRRLADPGEDDLLRGHAGGQRPAQLALRDHVGAGAAARQRAHDRQVGVRLERVADGRGQAGKRAREGVVGLLQRPRAVAVERRAEVSRQLVERHLLGVQPAVAGSEGGHWTAPDP